MLFRSDRAGGGRCSAAATGALNWGFGFLSYDLEEAALALPGFMSQLDLNSKQALAACMPAVNGMFTARSLAKMYALLAGRGELAGVRLISERRMDQVMAVQNRGMGKVIPLSMQWRLGYHRVFTNPVRRISMQNGFGHYGYGGSGAWADPDRKLSFGLVVNSGAGTPFGDGRILALTHAAVHCVNKR